MLIVNQLVNKFLDSYVTRSFITLLTRSYYWSLSWIRWTQSTTSDTISLRSILILPSHLLLGFQNDLYISGFPTKVLYAFIICRMLAISPFITLILFG